MAGAKSSSEVLPVGRLAPSPTGRLHLGHARSFLVAWWHARSRGGRIVLRIEDLDAGRVKPGMVEACFEDLRWLGLDWDGEPLLQSADTAPMREAVARLLADGCAYPCTCSRKEILGALSAPHAGGELTYPGTCDGRYASVEEAETESGGAAGIRFRVAEGALTLDDELAPTHTHDVRADVGDFLVARRDGVFAYQLAVVVDDARQGVTEVVRGEDLLSSTPRQWLLQEALGLPHPRWVHVPLVFDETGERLAKRSGSTSLAALREAGVDPRAVAAWAAGLDEGERIEPGDWIGSFDLARVRALELPSWARGA